MKEYTTESLRNVALVSHSSAGKTMLAEACLHLTGVTTRLGKIEDGTTVSDFDEEEIRRRLSLYTSVIPVEYKATKINFLDTPGYTDFIGEVISALRVADSAIVVIDSVAGLEVGTEIAWNYCDTFKLPRFVLINKMDRENADFAKAMASVQEFSTVRLIPVQLPWGEKADFRGVIDLISMKAYADAGNQPCEIPAELKVKAEEARLKLVEAAAEGDDALMERYFEQGTLTDEELVRGLRAILRSGSYVPVFVAAGGREMGIFPLLDAIVRLLPAPNEAPPPIAEGANGSEELPASDSGPLAIYVWKTTADPYVGRLTYFRVYSGVAQADARVWNQTKGAEERLTALAVPRGKEALPQKAIHAGDIGTVAKLSVTSTGNTLCDKTHPLTLPLPKYPNALYRVAIAPKTQADAAKVTPTLTRLCEEDMTLSWYNEPATGQTILQGMGDQHIDVALRRAETKLQAGLLTVEPKVPYREGITKKGDASYRHKKQTGGAGQFGEVWLRIEPSEQEFEFTDELVGMNLSRSYLPAIEKGIRATMAKGVIAGYPMSNVKVVVYDGKEHPVDSKPIAFEIAGREAFKLAVAQAGPVLFEPIMNVRITVPEANMGDVMSDLNTRRGRVQGTETEHGRTVILAQAPLAEMLRYTTVLRSITGGRGVFSMDFDHYEIVPAHLAQEIIAARQKEMEKEKAEE